MNVPVGGHDFAHIVLLLRRVCAVRASLYGFDGDATRIEDP